MWLIVRTYGFPILHSLKQQPCPKVLWHALEGQDQSESPFRYNHVLLPNQTNRQFSHNSHIDTSIKWGVLEHWKVAYIPALSQHSRLLGGGNM
jgi:hypothetical protein